MAVDLVSFRSMENHVGVCESASSSEMKTLEEQLLRILQSHHQQIQIDSKQALSRIGHARFRRGPLDPSSSFQSEPVKLVQVKSKPSTIDSKSDKKIGDESKSVDTAISSGNSSVTGDEGTVSNVKQGILTTAVTPAPRAFSSGKPPLPSSHRKRCREIETSAGISGKRSTRGCHCCTKRRKLVVKREIRRVTIKGSSSSKVGADDIPADEYSWRKYDQKLIPGTLFPRGYYKCNSINGCPARKIVEKDHNDPTVLILIYEGEHRHNHRSHSHHKNHHRHRPLTMMTPETLTRISNSRLGLLLVQSN